MPNILWYCTDQQRFDTIRSLGNHYINTPNLDRLVKRGVAFERAYTQCPICTPSRATFLTGRYPAAHRVQRNGNDYFPPEETLVTKLLADAGYDCGLAGKLHLSRAKGRVEKRSDDGYSFFKWSHHPMPDWAEGHAYADWLRDAKGVDPEELWGPLRGMTYGAGVPAEYHQTTWCTEMAMEFISQEREGPWLMSLNPFDPHPPFDPPKEYLDRYDPEKLPDPLFQESDVPRQKAFKDIDQQSIDAVDPRVKPEADPKPTPGVDTASSPPSSFDSRKVIASYYAMIELIDHEVGRLMDFLEERGELENTIIIFTSDHGELLGDHGLIYKGCRFFEALVHVPLIISWPERFKSDVRSSALVELVDLPQTILEAAGIEEGSGSDTSGYKAAGPGAAGLEKDAGNLPMSMQGKSLVPILEGSADPAVHKPYVTAEYYDAVDLPQGSHGTMYFDGRYKSVLYHDVDVCEMYDLEEDPGEFNNLFGKPEFVEKQAELLRLHCNALMTTVDPGIKRTGSY